MTITNRGIKYLRIRNGKEKEEERERRRKGDSSGRISFRVFTADPGDKRAEGKRESLGKRFPRSSRSATTVC